MINAVIFDLDGTVLDNEDNWDEVFMAVARKHKIPEPALLLPNGWWHEPGLGLSPNWRKLVRDHNKADELARETVRLYQERHREEDIKPRLREGVVEVVAKAKEKGWQTALCTGSNWYVVEKELEQLGLYLAFDVTTTGEEVLMAKPDPEIYLLTAQKLSLEPEECLVIEDAVAGVRSAAEAGMRVVGLVSEYAPEKMLLAAGAEEVIEGFIGFDL